jgi:hypothetical protein
MDNYLENIIKNKRVAIVGPSEHVCKELDVNHGKFIDSFDIIIRLNDFFYLPKELEQFYGSKYHIISSSFWHRANEDFDDKNTFWKKTRYCNEEDYKNINDKTILLECFARNEFSEIYRRYRNTIDKKQHIYGNISPQKYFQVLNLLRSIYPITKNPTTGFMTIGLILSLQPKELYVCGMTAYQDTKYDLHFDGYSRISMKESKYWPKNGFNGKTNNDKNGNENPGAHHNFQGEAEIMKILINKNIIKVDKYMNKLFGSPSISYNI